MSRFMRTHENEIKSLEKAMKDAKKGLSRRAFQDVPRELRRRTGSHNPLRVPKRLRMKARQEAIDDNTPIAKNKSGSSASKGTKKWLRKAGIEKSRKAKARQRKKKGDPNRVVITPAETEAPVPKASPEERPRAKGSGSKRKILAKLAQPPMPPSRFRRRQEHKTWLPTHIWHTKRATMTPPKEPIWRFAIPLAPATKTYRLTHRAASLRGAVAWDMSYMSTIGLEGVEASIIGLLKALHFAIEDGNKPWLEGGLGKKWRGGTRVWEGWIHEREGSIPKKITHVAVIWSAQESPEDKKRKAFIRVHPSAFLHLWNEVVRIAKVQKPAVTVEDLRFEIGSIEMRGPAAAETLCSTLVPSSLTCSSSEAAKSIWPSLASITDCGSMPPNPIVSFPCSDPRLRDPPQTAPVFQDPDSQSQLLETLVSWPIDKCQPSPAIFSRNQRLAAGRSLPSQKSINRRKTAATPGEYPEPRSTDPQIPMLTYISTARKTWTVLIPWKCVLPFWRAITRYPVSTGGNPRFGGLEQIRQVSYEVSRPCFPFDFPGTSAGWAWELHERSVREKEWTKRPKGKRVEWTTLDLGNGKRGELGDPWACEWERLLPPSNKDAGEEKNASDPTPTPFLQILSAEASELIAARNAKEESMKVPRLFTAKISMVQRGVPTTCARIYRLPTSDQELRDQWLALAPGPKSTSVSKQSTARGQASKRKSGHHSKHLQTKALAESLLEPIGRRDGPPMVGDDDYPHVPDEDDLIGFVTTGNYNLAEGKPTAIANLALHRVVEPHEDSNCAAKEAKLCIIREVGKTFGRLATWEVV